MSKPLETTLPEATFDPRHNIDLAEVMAYLGELKERGLDNGYRVGIVTKEIFGTFLDFYGKKYSPGEVVVFRDSESKQGTFVVGGLIELLSDPIMQEELLYKILNRPLEPTEPIDLVTPDYIREVK